MINFQINYKTGLLLAGSLTPLISVVISNFKLCIV